MAGTCKTGRANAFISKMSGTCVPAAIRLAYLFRNPVCRPAMIAGRFFYARSYSGL